MSGYQSDTTIEPGTSELMYGFRSGTTGQNPAVKNTCDIRVTAYDPFDFSVDWRIKYVRVRERSKFSRKRRVVWFYRIKPIPYPYYKFVQKTRSVKEWRLVLSAGDSVLEKIPTHMQLLAPQMSEKIKWLRDRLFKYGPCRPTKPREANIQNVCWHWSSEIQHPVSEGFLTGQTYTWVERPLITNGKFHHRSIEPPYEQYNDAHPKGAPLDVEAGSRNTIFESARLQALDALGGTTQVATLTAMLWPASGDFEEIGSTPLVDLTEMASDMAFPLGPPPSPKDAHSRMVEKCMSDDIFGTITESVDFAANSYLWTTLVLEPVVQGAIGLAAAVEANDKAIDAYTNQAKQNKWIQGKSLRVFGKRPGDAVECFNFPKESVYTQTYGSDESGRLTQTFDFKKFSGNAMLVYKLDEFDAALMNTSGKRLGQFFNRLSVSLDTVKHNLIPLSFVYDWFTSEYTGALNLKDKVYMPIADWKLVTSLNYEVEIASEYYTIFPEGYYYARDVEWKVHWQTGLLTGEKKYFNGRNIWYYSFCWNEKPNLTIKSGSQTEPNYNAMWTEFDPPVHKHQRTEGSNTEIHKFYYRRVFNRPARRTNFDGELGIQCFDHTKYGALDDTGKQVTLAAIIWGLIPGGNY